MAGFEVTRALLDAKAAEAVIAIREAFEQAETVNGFLATVPSDAPGGDPLTLAGGDFEYTADEAYLIRLVFQDLTTLAYQPILDNGRKLTGLS